MLSKQKNETFLLVAPQQQAAFAASFAGLASCVKADFAAITSIVLAQLDREMHDVA